MEFKSKLFKFKSAAGCRLLSLSLSLSSVRAKIGNNEVKNQ
jgi:hypothetical protein